MKKFYIYKLKGHVSIIFFGIMTIYLSIVSYYTLQYNMKLKTLTNLDSQYTSLIKDYIEKEEHIERTN